MKSGGNAGKPYWIGIFDPEGNRKGVYRSLFADVGKTFVFENGGEPITEGFTIQVYDSASSNRKLLQKITYPGDLCSNTGNVLGAFEIDNYYARGEKEEPAFVDSQALDDHKVKFALTFTTALTEGSSEAATAGVICASK